MGLNRTRSLETQRKSEKVSSNIVSSLLICYLFTFPFVQCICFNSVIIVNPIGSRFHGDVSLPSSQIYKCERVESTMDIQFIILLSVDRFSKVSFSAAVVSAFDALLLGRSGQSHKILGGSPSLFDHLFTSLSRNLGSRGSSALMPTIEGIAVHIGVRESLKRIPAKRWNL
ncbi:Uncharacterized protein Rs2_00935 [Raphanus sativus]|uniref:Uncharacterized protein LOC108854418 isoform X1 n=1 Tax=Raphanus sativus TaxID=3726 RepID=A0A6J0NG29_RAPSA|nr:uncharacterized protein LOC108854418 isoform X1 [Raphanus sativus]KAJ4915385.1 Uncharacterized protein Rs2_00935 [Raphanus sativus]